jgi:DNA-binding transcriptional LysR family regulator
MGTEICATAQGVELLLEHHSILSREFHARMEFALRKDVRFKNNAPPTKASQELHVSEPSVYQQVKSLQMSFARNLYKKTGRGIELTPEGRAFSAEAAEILRKAEELDKRFSIQPASSFTEHIVVGGSHVLSASILSSVLTTFKSTRPNLQLDFRTKSSPFIERLVVNNQVYLGLITNATSSSQLIVEPFRQEEMVVIISRRHPLAGKRDLRISELARGPLIIRGRKKSSSQLILKEVEQQGYRLNIFMKCDSAQAVKVAVARGLGLGLLYRSHVEQEIKTGELKVIEVPGLKKYIQSFIIYKAEKPLLPIAQELLELLRKSRQVKPNRNRYSAVSNLPAI